MRALIVAVVSGVALAAVSAQAAQLAPSPPSQASVDAAPPIEPVAEGCGPGSHRHDWIDRWGHWHWGQCVPNHW
jgi:hypothetical protein